MSLFLNRELLNLVLNCESCLYPIIRFRDNGKLLQILYRLYIVFNVKILN